MRRWLGCWFCAARGLFGMEVACAATTAGVQSESGWTLPTGQHSLLTSWSKPGGAADGPAGQRVRDPIWPGCSNDPLQIPRTQPSREPSDFADERAHRGYACDRSGREWVSDLGVDCSIRMRSGRWVTGTWLESIDARSDADRSASSRIRCTVVFFPTPYS